MKRLPENRFGGVSGSLCYEEWISDYDKGKLLIIDTDKLDFVQNQEDLGEVIQRIDTQINGLF